MTRPGRRERDVDEDDCCEHLVPLWEYCVKCEGDGSALFDADELGLDPEHDDELEERHDA